MSCIANAAAVLELVGEGGECPVCGEPPEAHRNDVDDPMLEVFDDDYKALIRQVRRAGHLIEQRGRHMMVRHRDTGVVVFFSGSRAGHGRGDRNFRAELRRKGMLP